ncbi:inhibitor of cysteine peptidase [Paucibacter oligotrophus]|uniref:Inhibitor of cysteine peptidase n=1 Tax=Roseateles oligotrophus TaxID=1769250 RepID=A0A840L2U2_9BURK|nr:protease inhibitor I42 family protein [Roseateles oligotrophus]MBB4842256.1 inhibitor of cysteine peptidase [Roseateles oligotrophus]
MKQTPATLMLSEADQGRELEVRPGDRLSIRLPENASTGYRWTVEHYDAALIEPWALESAYPAAGAGAAGEVCFVFRARKAGSTELVLKHSRSWEHALAPLARFRLQVLVQP